MRLVLTLLIGLIVGASATWATSYQDADRARNLIERYKRLLAMNTLTAQDITGVSCSAGHNKPGVDRANLAAVPGDAGFNSLLTALNTVLAAKMTAVKSELEALGVTNVP